MALLTFLREVRAVLATDTEVILKDDVRSREGWRVSEYGRTYTSDVSVIQSGKFTKVVFHGLLFLDEGDVVLENPHQDMFLLLRRGLSGSVRVAECTDKRVHEDDDEAFMKPVIERLRKTTRVSDFYVQLGLKAKVGSGRVVAVHHMARKDYDPYAGMPEKTGRVEHFSAS